MGKSAALVSGLFRDSAGWISAAFLLAIVLILWAPFNLHSGMPYETGFVYTSEISTWWNGFLFGADLSRMHTSTFFQAGYLLGELTGFAGSWVPYQIVYAALWWVRGFLMFLIVRRFLPGENLFCYLAGAFVLIHSSDLATAWVGQMPQSAYIFWMLAAFYLFVSAFDQRNRVWLAIAIFCEYMSLWTYESPIVIILLAPLLLIWLRFENVREWRAVFWSWYAVPVVYLVVIAIRYLRTGGHTYQESVLRKDWAIGPILRDWVFNIAESLRFWAWPGVPATRAPEAQLALIAALTVLILITGMFALSARRLPERRPLLRAMAVGILLIVFSFPVYLLLDSSRSLWRTQILSGLGAGLFLAGAVALFASLTASRWLRFGILATLSGWVAWCGGLSVLDKSVYHRALWEQHKHAMTEMLEVAPNVKPGTLIILTDVPRGERDPFGGDNMWFDMALRLAYPGTPVAGAYWYGDGTAPIGPRPMFDADGHWRLPGNPLVPDGDVNTILAMQYSEEGLASVMSRLPEFLRSGKQAFKPYNPHALIESGPPSPRAARRYGSRTTR